MTILMMLGALALHETQPVPKLSATTEMRWKQCGGEDPKVTKPTDLVAVCTAVIADRALDKKQRAYAYYWRGIAKSRIPNFDAALADFGEALAQPDLAEADEAVFLTGRGDLNRIAGNAFEAAEDLAAAEELAPNDPYLLIVLGKLAIAQRDFTKAREDLTSADQAGLAEHLHVQLHALRGSVFEQEGNQTSARADYDKAVEVGPKSVTALLERGSYLMRRKAFEGALADYVAATRLASPSAATLNQICWLLAANLRRELDRARSACDQATTLEPRNAGLRDSAGLVALQQKRWPDAWREYDLAVRLDPNMTSARFGRGIAALRLGRTAEGRADIAAAVKVNPTMSATYAGYGQKP